MQVYCPGCYTPLKVDEKTCEHKALLQCPECLHVFLLNRKARAGDTAPRSRQVEAPAEEATVLTTDFVSKVDSREFQWNVPGASLTVIEGDSQGIHRKLREGTITLGRKGADVEIADKTISRLHCQLSEKEDGWWITDLGSTNGTFVNGERIEEPTRLHHLDEIRIGRTAILFAEREAEEERSLRDRENEESSQIDLTKVQLADRPAERPLPAGREFYLEFMNGKKKGRSLRMEKSRIIIGRGEKADVVLEDEGVSRKHAMIEIHSRQQMYISDLASQNGTWLNGLRIQTTKLLPNDLLRLGSTVLKFVVQDLPE